MESAVDSEGHVMLFQVWGPSNHPQYIPVRKPQEGFDYATGVGARKVKDHQGETFYKLFGEWYGMGSQVKKMVAQGEKAPMAPMAPTVLMAEQEVACG